MIHDNDDENNNDQNQKDKQNHEVFANGVSDALASNGFASTLSIFFLCLDNDGTLKWNSRTVTNDLNTRNALSKGINDDVANIFTIAQNHTQSL